MESDAFRSGRRHLNCPWFLAALTETPSWRKRTLKSFADLDVSKDDTRVP